MNSFLKSLAAYLCEKHKENFDSFCFLFPNRRSQLFFKNYLKQYMTKPGWMPEMLTISDFMTSLSGLQQADPLELSFRIYTTYREVSGSEESFDDFYLWGETMISDFDDLDKYMVDAFQLFNNITELKEIDTVFDYLDEDQKKLVGRFWNHFISGKSSDHKENFLKLWKVMYPVYTSFREKLAMEGLAYEGMMYRKVAGMTDTGWLADFPWSKVIVIGFNALSRSEHSVFSYLSKGGMADFYWDYDTSYLDEKLSEAGRFVRENLELYPSDPAFDPGFSNLGSPKNISVYNLPSDVLQAKQLFGLLEEKKDGSLDELHDTAIILGDESLLPVVLTSLPSHLKHLNITMGYPVTQTPVYSFLDHILSLQLNYSSKKRKKGFYFRDVLSILNHQYLKSFYSAGLSDYTSEINRLNLVTISPAYFEKDPLLGKIFSKISTAGEMINALENILSTLLEKIQAGGESLKIEKEYIYIIRTRLIKLKNLVETQPLSDSLEGFIRLFRKILSVYNIPFQGEPLKGLQLMGILESRLLDFRNVYVLSLNEGVMPATARADSFIPYNLRFAFGLPVREDKDAIYAYYFYRLAERAENLALFYNSKTEGMKSGEPSRYIYQLQYLSEHEPVFYTTSFRISPGQVVEFSIKKTPEILKILEAWRIETGQKYLSPSALTTYMDCSLRFYFSYVAGLWEEDEVSEEIDASGFGSLYHKAMELSYLSSVGKELKPEDFKILMDEVRLRKILDQAYRLEFLKTKDETREVRPEGKNIIVYEIILKMLVRTLSHDRASAPFVYLESEREISTTVNTGGRDQMIRLGGKIDRIDRRNGKIHILDYKTGNVNTEFDNPAQLFDRDSWGAKNLKGVFQTFLYSWLYRAENSHTESLIPGIYRTSALFTDDFTTSISQNSFPKEPVNYLDYHDEFNAGLVRLIEEIFDPALEFVQTGDTKRCRYCPYAGICHR